MNNIRKLKREPKRISMKEYLEFMKVNSGQKTLPFDLTPKPARQPVKPLTEEQFIQRRLLQNSEMLTATFVLDRGLTGISTSITTTPVRIIQARSLKGYILTNPTISTGKANSGTVLASAARAAGASGNTQSNSIDVSDYKIVSLFLDITANASANTISINTQTQDPVSGGWATSQSDIFTSPSAVGTYYETIGGMGVDENFAVSWSVSAVGGTTTFSLGYILKDASASFSLSNVIYLGGPAVTSTAGYPLIEGHEVRFFLKANAELWAVSSVATGLDLKMFELQ